ncbi:hypothetical protein FOL47_000200 [Perkinsus chesapeaki]|uniref:Uncharacterized protein n=1 Tax=Perkinsus chesapeaki TaxID=330153 RepID=A0A7J6MP18_PERCH|nr:hypothetical protein FOL47_000200 [Perkinsus chesapeaki]
MPKSEVSTDDDPVVDEQLVVVHFRELAHSHFGKAVNPDTVRLVGMDKPGDGKLILEANGEEVAFDAVMAEPPGSFLILEKGPETEKSEGDRAAGEEEPRHGGYKVYGTTRGMIDVSVPRLSAAPVSHNTSDPLASAPRAPRGGGAQKGADESGRSSTIGGAM